MLYHQGIATPKLSQGIARSPGQSLYPELWNELIGFWAPSVGHQGITTLRDFSIRKNHGTLIGSMNNNDWIIGNNGYALDYDGTNDAISIPNILNTDCTTPFTFVIWFKTTSSTNAMRLMAEEDTSSTPDGIGFQVSGAKVRVLIRANNTIGNDIDVRSTENFNSGTWRHAVFTYDGSKTAAGIGIYVDGIKRTVTVSSDGLTGNPAVTNVFKIGGVNGGGAHFNGSLGDASIYGRMLTPNEIFQSYMGASPLMLKRHVYGKAPPAPPSAGGFVYVGRFF